MVLDTRSSPAVKNLHLESQSNSKPEYIFGHSCQVIAVAVKAAESLFDLPLACRIHEGVIFTNRDKCTLMDKLILLFNELGVALPCVWVGDAYYATAKIILPLLQGGNHLVTALKTNAVAYEPAPSLGKRKRGRPRCYGPKVRLKTLFDDASSVTQAPSPVYGEKV